MAVIPVRVSKPGRSLLSMKMDTDTDEFKFIPTIQGLQVMGTHPTPVVSEGGPCIRIISDTVFDTN